MTENELTKADKAKIASRSQAAAHKELRERHPDEYQDAYRRAKQELTDAAERHGAGVV